MVLLAASRPQPGGGARAGAGHHGAYGPAGGMEACGSLTACACPMRPLWRWVKMVLVGKQNKDIVPRLGRHGAAGGGPVRDGDGRPFGWTTRVSGEWTWASLATSSGRRRRAEPHRRGLHTGDRVGWGRPGGQLLQRERRASAPAWWPGAGGLQGDLPDRRGRLARDPEDLSSKISEATAEEVRSAWGVGGGGVAEARGLPAGLESGVNNAHIIDGRTLALSCSSCSPTRGSARS